MVATCRIPNSLALSNSHFCFLVSFVSNRSVDHAKGSVVAIERAITGSILSYRFTQYCSAQAVQRKMVKELFKYFIHLHAPVPLRLNSRSFMTDLRHLTTFLICVVTQSSQRSQSSIGC